MHPRKSCTQLSGHLPLKMVVMHRILSAGIKQGVHGVDQGGVSLLFLFYSFQAERYTF